MTSRAVFLLAATGLAAALAPAAQGAITLANGQAVTLSSILGSDDHQVNIGDKVFTFSTFTSATFVASNISITGFIAANPNDGIGFDITGGFGDVFPADGLITEFNLLYTVSVQAEALRQGYRLKDVGLVYNGSATGTGSYSRVDESIFDANGQPGQNLLATLSAAAIAGSTPVLQDYRDFSPANYTSLQVNKDVKFFANGVDGSASASFIRQSFSQVVIPSPSAAGLLGLGGLVAIRRRRA